MITAPYNFVPLNKEIFYPEWGNKFKEDKNGKKIHDFPAHDVPFEDGESGEIDITIEAKSPIFVKDHEQQEEFCHIKDENGAKHFYIPGSSIKGMIRNIVEIMSFSKIRIDEAKHKKTMGVRDMSYQKILVGTASGLIQQTKIDSKDKKFYEDKNIGFGFLKIDQNGNGYLDDYGNPRTIDGREIKKAYSRYWFKEEDLFKKYKTIPPYSKIKIKLCEDKIYAYNKKKKIEELKGKKKIAKYDPNGEEAIVFQNNYIQRKSHEFVLAESDMKARNIEIQERVLKNFKLVYFSEGSEHTHKLGQFWKTESQSEVGTKYGIPVFYTRNSNGEINAIGLTQLFKLAYKKTILQAAKQNTQEGRLDLAQTIFGTEDSKNALKGRVYFSHLKSNIERYEADKEVEQVLGSPNPSYYPNYIEQTNLNGQKVNSYTTLMDSNATIRGYKRYPLQNQVQSYNLPTKDDGKENQNVTTKFKPLQKGTTFKGKLKFHNLKKEELGAILSALTFHGQNSKYLHNIGMAKPLGYGKIEIKLEYKKPLKHTQEEYLKSFENMMNNWDKKEFKSWKDSKHIQELLSMSDNSKAKVLKYQQMEKPTGSISRDGKEITTNEFVDAKKAKEYLLPHLGKVGSSSQKEKKHNKNQEAFNNPFKKLKRK